MQKKLIALAVAGLASSAAFAQSNVTIYGTMDATFDNLKAGGTPTSVGNEGNRNRITMNSSFIGFKGSEDLGNGLKAVFQVESGVGENATGQTANAGIATTYGGTGSTYGLATRDTYIGLAGGFGTLVAGNLTGPTRLVASMMDVNTGATGIGANTALLGKIGAAYDGAGASAFDQRISNAVAYISPTWSGFHFAIGYMANENRTADTAAGTARNISAWDMGAVYAQGPILAALTYETLKDKGSSNASNIVGMLSKASDTRLSVKYDFGVGTVGLLMERVKGDIAAANVDAKRSGWYLPVTFKAGPGKVLFQYGKAKDATGSAFTGVTDTGATHTSLGYEYSLSKRTIVKAIYSQINNKANAGYDFLYGVNAASSNTTGLNNNPAAGADPRGFSVGVRHSF